MSLEDIYIDLEAIAKHRGSLDEDAVRRATAILAQPRYAATPAPATLLVADLKRVIEAIPNYPSPATSPPWASQNFRDYARRYFSLDGAGQTLSHRRAFGRRDPGGSVIAWMHRAILYRVAAGLIELWTAANNGDTNGNEPAPGYRIDSVQATTHNRPDFPRPVQQILTYDLRLITSGPHLHVLPYLGISPTLTKVSPEQADDILKPQLVKVQNERGWTVTAAIFGAQQPPGEQIQVQIENRPLAPFSRREFIWSQYNVDQPIQNLVLEVNLVELRGDYKWQVTSQASETSDPEVIDEPFAGRWACESPDIGRVYTLSGTKLSRAERRQKRMAVSTSISR